MTNDFARKNMWDDSYRPEQLFTRDFLAKKYPDSKIELEVKLTGLTIDGKPYRDCKPDIVIRDLNLVIRLNGMYHYASSRQKTKDDFQKEALKQAGWEVVDFDCRVMENLFKKKKNEETVKLAEKEIEKQLGKVSRL